MYGEWMEKVTLNTEKELTLAQKAEEMFKELGFYKEQSEIISSRIWCLNEDCRIIFDAINEAIFLENVNYVPLQLLDAINKQIEELKWR